MDVGKLNAPYQITEIDPWLAPYESDIVICTLAFTERKADGFSGNGCRERMKYA